MFTFSENAEDAGVDAASKKQKMLERLQKRNAGVSSQHANSTVKPDPDAQANVLLDRATAVLAETDKTESQELSQEFLDFINKNPKSRFLPVLRAKRDELNRIGLKTTFKFGAAKKTATPSQAIASPSPEELPATGQSGENTIKDQRIRVVPDEVSSTIVVERVNACVLKFPFEATSVQLTDVRDSTLVFLPVRSSFLVRNCHNTTLVASAQQIRIHDSSDLTLYARVRGSVIIENCRNVRVAPYRIDSPDDSAPSSDLSNSELPPISDFDAPAGVSPNWGSIPESQWQSFSLDL